MPTDIKNLYADTNIFLDFFYSRDKTRCTKIREVFQSASEGKVKIIVIPQIVFELVYVIEKTYGESRSETYKYVATVVNSRDFEVHQRGVLSKTLDVYRTTKFDLVDIYLRCLAQNDGSEVFSFDKDLERLKNQF